VLWPANEPSFGKWLARIIHRCLDMS
jgi:hypothetical protein